MTQKPPKTPRRKTELPEHLSDGTVIAEQPSENLVVIRDNLIKLLADVPRIELELRAVRAQIRRKA